MSDMDLSDMNLLGVVNKLVGAIEPIGVSEVDEARHKNLLQVINLMDSLIEDIRIVSKDKCRHEGSMRMAGETAFKALESWGITDE